MASPTKTAIHLKLQYELCDDDLENEIVLDFEISFETYSKVVSALGMKSNRHCLDLVVEIIKPILKVVLWGSHLCPFIQSKKPLFKVLKLM